MASQCKRQQCTIDRRGFRQELDSWRHKLIHCVGFESILEGLFGSELVEDLKLFKDLEPVTVSDWSFDENCLFCCLRRDKVKEHLIGNEGLQDTLKPLLVKDQITISRLEKQAEEFLNAVLCRKDVPSFLDPHIPVVAREILQRMIRQFAAEYTSKTSSPQDSSSDPQPVSDQSQPSPPLLSGAPPSSPAASQAGSVHNQNPVLSKLLMADQDAPLDLTIKKPQSEPSEQEGVLDLSIKKNRHSSCLPARSSCLSPVTSSLKGECPDVRLVKAKELQSTSTLEQFMAKLCRHHQRQIIDAIGFLQTEVKALASSKTQPTFAPASRIQGPACSTPKSSTNSPEKSCSELRILSETNLKPEVQDMSHSFLGSCVMKKSPETIVALKTSVTAGPVLDLRSPGSGGNQALIPSSVTPVDTDNNRHSDHAPLKMKIMKTSNIAAGKKLSCVLTSSLSSDSGTLEERQGNSNSSSRTETHGARLSSSVKRHNQLSHAHQARQRDTLGHAKDVSAKPYSAHTAIPVESPRTARKTIRGSAEHQNRDSACRGIVDPELGHCDIVYIDKPITECLKEQQRNMLPRRNARKSTRGHMYSDEIWEIKTVRTLAGRGNCPNPMPELTTPVTPKQVLSKPEGVPPVDMPFAGTCRETMSEQMSTEDSDERVIPGTGDMVEEAAIEADVIVETSQTDQCLTKTQASPPPLTAPESPETDLTTDIQQDTTEDSGKTESQESIVPPTFEVEETCEPEPPENTDSLQVVSETIIEAVENQSPEEAEPQLSSDNMQRTEPVLVQTSEASPLNQVEEEAVENETETVQAEQAQEPQADAQTISDNTEETKEPAPEMLDEQEAATAEAERVTPHETVETVEGEDDDEYDVSSKTLDSLLKELPPWRRKKGMRILLPKRLRQTETVIVGYVNGRPISASDRSLRRRLGSTSPGRTPLKSSPIKAPVESEAERVNLENHAAEKPTNLTSSPPPQVKDQPSETPVSTPTKPLSGAAKSPKCKKAKTDQQRPPPVPEQTLDSPKRQLRSTSQKPGGTPASPSSSATSVPSPKRFATQDSTPSPPPLPPPPLGPPSPPAAPEQVECSSVQDVPMETNSEDSQQVTSSAGETSEIASESLEKPIPTNAGVDESENDQQQNGSEESAAGESQTAVKAEAPIVPQRAKRALRNTAEAIDSAPMQKPNVASLKDGLAQAVDSESSAPEKPTRMPLRSETSKVEATPESVPQSPVDAKKLSLRSQKSPASSGATRSVSGRQCDAASPLRLPERSSKAQARPPPLPVERVLPHSSSAPGRSEPPNKTNKFFEALTGEENQQMLTNLNIKYDKMQKGWVQMDKEGQPATKYRNKADRQAAIWKSKRRARKPKSSDHQKYSPVQMLFMKGFDLKSICRWFLESTETKSLVIVKKVNTRLPSETQLCFHSSSGGSGTSQGVFPSLQAERLKKHLKKFAIASPVKSNPKSQKLIAKALEQEASVLRGKERREPPCTMQSSTSEAPRKRAESQKTAGKSKNPASARILRKYSNIRGKMQVQQTNVRLKDGPKRLQANSLKRLADAKAASKSSLKPPLKARRPAVPVNRQLKESAAKMEKQKIFPSKKAQRPPVKERAVKAQNSTKPSRDATRKDLPKRCSQRLGSPKVPEQNPGDAAKSKTEKKPATPAVKDEGEKPAVSKTNVAKVHAKEESVERPVESPQQGKEAKTQEAKTQEAKTQEAKTQETKTQEAKTQEAKTPAAAAPAPAPAASDQVLTRSQRKMEASATQPAKKSGKATAKTVRKASEPSPAPKAPPRPPAKRSQAATLPRSATKSAMTRAQELLAVPAKRTRTSK